MTRRGRAPLIPDEVLIDAYRRTSSVHKVGAEVGLNYATVAYRLNRAGVQLQKRRPKGDRKGIPLNQPEKEFMASVIDLAQWLGWSCYHTWVSLHSAAGFPDLVLVKPPRVIFAELKSDRGFLKPAQALWLKALRECPGVEVYEWRPSMIEEITDILGREP